MGRSTPEDKTAVKAEITMSGYEPVNVSLARLPQLLILEEKMAEGTIKRITDKGFGFITDGTDKDMFFHSSQVEGTSFDQLTEGQRVSFDVGQGPKGPCAENVKIA